MVLYSTKIKVSNLQSKLLLPIISAKHLFIKACFSLGMGVFLFIRTVSVTYNYIRRRMLAQQTLSGVYNYKLR